MKNLSLLIFFISLIFYSSCSYPLYAPNPEIVEPVNEKGQLQTSLSIGHSNSQKYAFGLNYGLTNNIAISASGAIGPKQNHITSALGYYKNLSTNSFIDIYGGIHFGQGYSIHYDSNNSLGTVKQDIKSTYVKPFISIGLHRIVNKIQYDFTLSAGRMDFTKFEVISTSNGRDYVDKLIEITPLTLIQPGLRIAYLDDLGKLYFGLVFTPHSYIDYDLHGYNLFVGGSTDLGKLLWSNK